MEGVLQEGDRDVRREEQPKVHARDNQSTGCSAVHCRYPHERGIVTIPSRLHGAEEAGKVSGNLEVSELYIRGLLKVIEEQLRE